MQIQWKNIKGGFNIIFKKNKILVLFLLIICIILTTSFVSAIENSTDKFQNEDNILLKDNDYKNFTDLSKEIDDLNKTELIWSLYCL